MGIRKLNAFLLSQCSNDSISRVSLFNLQGKTLVIDTSIYLYKFLSEDNLLDGFFNMISIFKTYLITPIFVFDGKPPEEKKDTLIERICRRKEAEQKYNEQKESIETTNLTPEKREEEISKLSSLKRQFIRVNETHIQQLKQLFSNFNILYIESPSEADQVCAYFTRTKQAYACVSDDMDMFVYDCPIIIRKLSLQHHNCIVYNTESIKKELDLDQFPELLMLCGTDYNTDIAWDISTAIGRFKFYKDECYRKQTTEDFYNWLETHSFVTNEQYNKIKRGYELFKTPETMDIKVNIYKKNWEDIQNLFEEKGYIFAD